jgi:hypothetical protein
MGQRGHAIPPRLLRPAGPGLRASTTAAGPAGFGLSQRALADLLERVCRARPTPPSLGRSWSAVASTDGSTESRRVWLRIFSMALGQRVSRNSPNGAACRTGLRLRHRTRTPEDGRISPDSEVLYSCGRSGRIRQVWMLRGGQVLSHARSSRPRLASSIVTPQVDNARDDLPVWARCQWLTVTTRLQQDATRGAAPDSQASGHAAVGVTAGGPSSGADSRLCVVNNPGVQRDMNPS